MKTSIRNGIAIVCLGIGFLPVSSAVDANAPLHNTFSVQTFEVDFSKFTPWKPDSGEGDFLITSPYSNPPEATPRDNVPHGMIYRFTMNSTDSKIYPGISKTA